MTARYELRELIDTLQIRVVVQLSLSERLLAAGVIGSIVAVFSYQSSTKGWWWLAIALSAATLVFFRSATRYGGGNVSKLEFNTWGFGSGRGARRPRTIFTNNISCLKFLSQPFLTSTHSDGLYAVAGSEEVLLLPYLNYKQTIEIIQAIERKFPSLAERWGANQTIHKEESNS